MLRINRLAIFFICLFLVCGIPATRLAAQHDAAASPKAEAPAQGAVEHGSEAKSSGHEGPGLLDIDWAILLSQVLNFFILLFLLKKFLFGPIQGILEARKTKISGTLEAAEAENRKACELKAEYEKKLGTIEQEAYQIRQKAVQEAQSAKDEILSDAKAKATAQFDKAQKDISIEKQKAWTQLKDDMVKLTLNAAEKIVEQSLDDKIQHALIRKTIDRLDEQRIEGEKIS